LELLDLESAKKNNLVLAKVYSEQELDANELEEIEVKIEKKISRKTVIKNIIKENWGGITVEVDGKIVDLSIEGKVNNLKRKLIV